MSTWQALGVKTSEGNTLATPVSCVTGNRSDDQGIVLSYLASNEDFAGF